MVPTVVCLSHRSLFKALVDARTFVERDLIYIWPGPRGYSVWSPEILYCASVKGFIVDFVCDSFLFWI